jgi:hypothetical protein
MHVYGQLKSAQLENRTTDHAAAVVGMCWWRTDLNQFRISDGTAVFNILSNNSQCIFGNHATAANNIRLHRGASEVLQLVLGNDVTAEGTLSTALGQLSVRAENYATVSLPAVGNAGRLAFDTSTSTLKYDTGITWQEVAAGLNTGIKNYVLGENLTAGDPVIVNSDETISKVKYSSSVPSAAGVSIGPTLSVVHSICYDSTNHVLVVAYLDSGDSSHPKVVIGTITNGIISFGTPTVVLNATSSFIDCCFDPASGKVIICYTSGATTSMVGLAVTGTVSGTAISLGTPAQFSANQISALSCTYDPYNNSTMVMYSDAEDTGKGKAIIGYVTSGEIGFSGSAAGTFSNLFVVGIDSCYDLFNRRVIACYLDNATNYPYVSVLKSLSTVTAGTAYQMSANTVEGMSICYDSINNKILIAYADITDSNKGKIKVGIALSDETFYTTNITTSKFLDAAVSNVSIIFDPYSGKFVVNYINSSVSGAGFIIVGELNNTLIPQYGTPVQFASTIGSSTLPRTLALDTFNNLAVVIYRDGDDSNEPKANVVKILSPKQCVGVVNASGTTGQTKAVSLTGAMSSAFLSKVPSAMVYIQSDGTIGYQKTRYPIGQFVSTTELQLGKGE